MVTAYIYMFRHLAGHHQLVHPPRTTSQGIITH